MPKDVCKRSSKIECSIVSKAAERSNRVSNDRFPLSMAFNMSLTTLIRAVSFLCPGL